MLIDGIAPIFVPETKVEREAGAQFEIVLDIEIPEPASHMVRADVARGVVGITQEEIGQIGDPTRVRDFPAQRGKLSVIEELAMR